MSDYTLRPWQPEDKPRLKALWALAFGDSDAYIDAFFRALLKKDGCIVAECDGQVVSAMYILGGNTVYPYRKNLLSAGYTYALATHPDYRGRGIGRAVYAAATAQALERHDMALVLPAEERLYPFYAEASGARVMSIMREAVIPAGALASVAPARAARIPAFQYFGLRESLLAGLPHVSFSEDMMSFLEEYFETAGDFFVTESGIAAAETANGKCRITELLCPDGDDMAILAGIHAYIRAGEYTVRSPFFFDGPGDKKPVMLGVMNAEPDYPMPFDLWWGFGLD